MGTRKVVTTLTGASLVPEIQRMICDCIEITHETETSLQLSFPCLKSLRGPIRVDWLPDSTDVRVSDHGLIQQSLAGRSDRKRIEQHLRTDATAFGVELSGTEWTRTTAVAHAADAVSRVLQFISHCDRQLELSDLPVTASTRQRVELLIESLLEGQSVAVRPAGTGTAGPESTRLVLKSRPEWSIFVIDCDTDAVAAIRECQRLRQHSDVRILAIYRNQLRISRKLVAALTDLVDRQFSTIQAESQIRAFLAGLLTLSG